MKSLYYSVHGEVVTDFYLPDSFIKKQRPDNQDTKQLIDSSKTKQIKYTHLTLTPGILAIYMSKYIYMCVKSTQEAKKGKGERERKLKKL